MYVVIVKETSSIDNRHGNAKKCLPGGIITCDGPSEDVME